MFLIHKAFLHRKELLVVISILVIASDVRFWDIGDVGFNNDEAVYSGQAASLAGYEQFQKHFSLTRAHPLLFQFIVSILYYFFGVSDVAARLVSATFGTLTILVLYLTGRLLYDKKVAVAAALVTAVLPYHIIVTKQAMVDVPLSFFFVLTVYFMAKYMNARTHKSNTYIDGNRIWLYGIGASCGLSFLSKEVGILTLIASIVFMTITKRLKFNILVKLVTTFTAVISPHIIFILSSGERVFTKILYFNWQTNRPPNHSVDFYFEVLGMALGYVLGILLIVSIIYSIKNRKDSNLLLLTFIVIPFIFFQLWSTKGYHYLVSLIPLAVLLTTSFILTSNWMKRLPYNRLVSATLIIAIILSTSNIVNLNLFDSKETKYLAGMGGLPNAKETAIWIKENTHKDSTIMTIGPTMGNVIKFYSNRDAVYLNLNPNRSQHNPAYTPIEDAELLITSGRIDYLVYDKYSERRSLETADKLYYFVNKYDIIPVYVDYETRRTPTGKVITEPAVIVYRNYADLSGGIAKNPPP